MKTTMGAPAFKYVSQLCLHTYLLFRNFLLLILASLYFLLVFLYFGIWIILEEINGDLYGQLKC